MKENKQRSHRHLPSWGDLICLHSVFYSHEDYSVVEDIYAGFDSEFNLVIVCEHTDYEDPAYNCATYAIVDKGDAYKLSKRLKVSLRDLPKEIRDCMSDWSEIRCPDPSDVRACFKEITECIIGEGCHFRIERKAGANGFVTC